MHLGEKIRQLRAAKGLSQENLAFATGKSKAHISRLERGDAEIDNKILVAIKKFLEIENAPLFEHELEIYRERIWNWDELLHNKRMDEAKTMKEELSIILDLPYERELLMLYKMIEARMLSIEYDNPAVEERLNYVEGFLDEASNDVLYLYHRVKGALEFDRDNNKAFLKHCLLALDYNNNELRPDVMLVLNIGVAYARTGRLLNAIRYFERFMREYRGDRTHMALLHVEKNLATSFMILGEFNEAKKLFETALVKARNLNNDIWIGGALISMGQIHHRTGNYKTAIELYDDSLEYFHESKMHHVSALVLKAECLIALNDYRASEDILDQAKALAGDNEELILSVEATGHMMTLYNKQSTDYLESVALPYYIKGGLLHLDTAIRLCDKLEAQYRKRGANKKAEAIVAISRDIYKGICGVGDFD